MKRISGGLRWLLIPFWAVALFSVAKPLRAVNPLLTSPALNRRGLHVWRVRLAHRMTARRRAKLAHLVSPEDRAAFEENGFVLKADFLAPADFAALRRQVEALTAEARDMKQGHAVTRHIPLSRAVWRRAPAIAALVEDSRWKGLTRYVSGFNAEPIIYLQAVQAHVDDSGADPQSVLHMDVFFPSMKAWFYLEDVALENGPFVYVPGSHRLTPRRLAWERRQSIRAAESGKRQPAPRFEEGEVLRLYGTRPRPLAVPANTLVVGDTVGIHARGRSAGPCVRIEIWGYSRHNPFLPWTGVDLWSVPVLRNLRAAGRWAVIGVIERLKARGLLGLPDSAVWRRAGRVRLSTPYQHRRRVQP